MMTSVPAQLFAAFLMIYMITAPGGYECVDAVQRYDTAKSWVSGKGGVLAKDEAPVAPVGPDGRAFSFYGPFQSLLMVPEIVLAKASLTGSPDLPTKLMFGLVVIPFISALSMALLFVALVSLGYSRRAALWTTFVVGLGTLMWHYGRSGQEENIIGLAFGLYLLGMSWLFAERYAGLVLVAVASSIVVSTRWAYGLALAVILLPVSIFLWRRRAEASKWIASLAIASGLGIAVLSALFWYNYYRFSNPFETGYALQFHQHGGTFFVPSHIPTNAAALLFSPSRGLFWFCPVVLILFGLHKATLPPDVARLWPYLVAAWVVNLVFASSYSVWTAGFAWGPRFLVAPIILLAPLFAAVFESGQRWLTVTALSLAVQICSVILPSGTEDYVTSIRMQESFGSCTPWSCECSALCLRPPRVLRAIANTALGRPLPVIDSDGGAVSNARVLESSDYNSIYWWLVRAAFRAHKLSPPLALVLSLLVLAAAGGGLARIYMRQGGDPEEPFARRPFPPT